MRQDEVKVGKTYAIRFHDGLTTPVTILSRSVGLKGLEPIGTKLRYVCRNEWTGRIIVVKSATKFRFEVVLNNGRWTRL